MILVALFLPAPCSRTLDFLHSVGVRVHGGDSIKWCTKCIKAKTAFTRDGATQEGMSITACKNVLQYPLTSSHTPLGTQTAKTSGKKLRRVQLVFLDDVGKAVSLHRPS